jgi:hypothetical protein
MTQRSEWNLSYNEIMLRYTNFISLGKDSGEEFDIGVITYLVAASTISDEQIGQAMKVIWSTVNKGIGWKYCLTKHKESGRYLQSPFLGTKCVYFRG